MHSKIYLLYIFASERFALKTFLINLDSDTERLSYMERQLERENISFERFSAIRGDQLPDWLVPFFYEAGSSAERPASWLSRGEIGCYASHLAIMREIVATQETVLVLEDDAGIPGGFSDLIHECLSHNIDWDILRLSSMDRYPIVKLRRLNDEFSFVNFLKVPGNTGAFLLRPSGAKKFLELACPRVRPVDQDLRRNWENQMRTVGIYPRPVIPNQRPSTIASMGGRVTKRGGLKYRYDSKHHDRIARAIFNLRAFGLRATLRGMLFHK